MLKIETSLEKRLARIWLSFLSLRTREGVYIRRGSTLFAKKVCIGAGTRFNGACVAKGQGELNMGQYCAVGWGVRFITSNHSMTRLNLNLDLQYKLVGLPDRENERQGIHIGHNVWIGDGTIILPGVNIGNGAIIGAGSIVTRSVEPYVVAAGNPARKIRPRFRPEVVSILEQSKIWDRNLKELGDVHEALAHPDFASLSISEVEACLQLRPTVTREAA